MEMTLLRDGLIVLGIAIVVLLIGSRIRMPLIIGFLITGVLAGPQGFAFIHARHEVEILAEIGVVLLLFTIGVELSLKSIIKMRRMLLVGGVTQMALTTAVVGLTLMQLRLPWQEALILAMSVSLSSTAIVLRLLQTRGELDAPHGRIGVAILVFQDLAAIPILLSIPLLAGTSGAAGLSAGKFIGQAVVMIGIVIVLARWVVPRLMEAIAATRNRELFLISVVVMCFGVALLASSFGLSLALGAFLAGLIISESEYSHQALGNITPFRDLFTSFFFVAVGLMLDIDYIISHPVLILGMALGLIVLKSIIAAAAAMILGYPARTAVLAGLSLGQTGEFAFIVAAAAVSAALLTAENYRTFLAISALSMAATPFLIALAPRVADRVSRSRIAGSFGRGKTEDSGVSAHLNDHLIIIGFGVNGTNVARASQNAGIPYIIVEMNPATIKRARGEGQPIHAGDAAREPIWQSVGVTRARIAVIAISDIEATRQAVSLARHLNPDLRIVARTRYLNEIETLLRLGANEVIPEEFETSVEIFSRVLRYFFIPERDVEAIIRDIRSENYQILRKASPGATWQQIESVLSDMRACTVRISEQAEVVGKNLMELQLRNRYGVTLLMLKRGEEVVTTPDTSVTFKPDDLVVLYGDESKVREAADLFRVS